LIESKIKDLLVIEICKIVGANIYSPLKQNIIPSPFHYITINILRANLFVFTKNDVSEVSNDVGATGRSPLQVFARHRLFPNIRCLKITCKGEPERSLLVPVFSPLEVHPMTICFVGYDSMFFRCNLQITSTIE